MGAYSFPDAGLLGQIDSLDAEVSGFAAAVSTLKPGDLVFTYKGESKAYGYLADTAKAVYSADFVASNSIAFSVNGTAITPVVYATSHAATMTALINAIKALTGVEAILDSTDSNGRTILIRVKGATAAVTSTVTLGASQATMSATYASGQLFRGVVKYATRVPTAVSGTGTIAIGEEVSTARLTDIWAASASGLVRGQLAYITTGGVFGTSGVDVGVRAVGDYDSGVVGTKVRLPILPAPLTYGDRF